MSNINKQALRQLAVDAKELAIIKRYTKGIEAQKKFIAEMTPATVLALLDELEASQKSNEFLKGQLAELANFNPDWDKLEASYESWREIAAELLVAKDRIAELEARELVVNLPAYVDGRTLGYGEVNHMIDLCADAIEKAGHAAGIITKVGE